MIGSASDNLDYDEYSDVWSEMYDNHSDAWSEMYDSHSDAWSLLYDNHSDVWSGFYDKETDVDKILNNAKDNEEEKTDKDTDNQEEKEPSSSAKPVDGTEHQSDDFKYLIYDDGTVEIIKYTGNDSSVTISSEIDDYPVGRIGASAFENCTSIESIIMWSDPVSIGKAAFRGCSNLQDFSIPSSVTVIGDSTFENCTSLETIIIWGDVTSIGESAFKNCSALTDVSIPSSCVNIGKSAFEGCGEMESVIFWGGEVIGERAFMNCSSIEDISIPSEVTTIGASAFEGCSSLESVIIWGDDVEIGVNAFANCPKLDELPEGAVNTNTVSTTSETENNTSGLRPEFKAAMDSYEDFYDEYCDFMKKYKANPTDTTLLSDYADMMQELVDVDEKFKEWEGKDLNNEELKYYIDVSSRISQKLIDVAM